MRTKLFIGTALAVAVAITTVAFAGGFAKAKPVVTPQAVTIVKSEVESQPSSATEDCCLECILCCAIDGGCWECFQCCIEMGCDPSFMFSDQTVKKSEACCADAKGCCEKPAKKAKACCDDGCCKK